MAVDEALLLHHARGETPPTVRFYTWSPPAVSIGYFQDAAREVDLEACQKQGITVVRRLTGGRAILHDREVTYSLVAAEDGSPVSGTVLESYLKISRGLLQGLRKLGVPAGINEADAARRATPACFQAPARYELVVGERKLVGSAQARKHGCVLQHGSIPLLLDADRLFTVLNFSDAGERRRLLADFKNGVVSLNEAGGRSYSYAEVVMALADGLAGVLGVELEKGKLTPQEVITAQRLVREKYGRDQWNRKTVPRRLV